MLYQIWKLCRIYQRFHGRWPNLLFPRRYTEKMQWRKLFDNNPVFPVLCDKLAVRDFIAARAGDEYLVPLLWSGASDIPLEDFAPPYVLKSSHASGQVMMIGADDIQDFEKIRAIAAWWIAQPYGVDYCEQAYFNVPRRLLIEPVITTADGAAPLERRLFVFNGKVAVINTVFTEDKKIRNGAFHTPGWKRLNWHFTRFLERDFPAPAKLPEMIRVAELLGQGLDHVRVDFYDCGEKFLAGELTLYSWSGLSKFCPDEADFALGKHWHLRGR